MKVKLFITFLFALAIGVAVAWWLKPVTSPGAPSSADGLITPISSSALRDHVRDLKSPVVMINFWASWCGPCKAEFPHILSLREKLKERGLRILFVSIDDPIDLPAASEFLHQSGVGFPTYYKGTQSVDFVREFYPQWQGAIPTSVLLSPELKLLDAWEGEATSAELEQRLTKQLPPAQKGT